MLAVMVCRLLRSSLLVLLFGRLIYVLTWGQTNLLDAQLARVLADLQIPQARLGPPDVATIAATLPLWPFCTPAGEVKSCKHEMHDPMQAHKWDLHYLHEEVSIVLAPESIGLHLHCIAYFLNS